MTTSRRLLALTIAVLGAAVAVLPAVAGSETGPTIAAENKPGGGYYGGETHAWAPAQATVGEGGVVTLSNPTEVPHGVKWVSGPETPTCSGVPVGTTATASGTKWSGTCTFGKAGVYTFYCTVHGPEMTGTITVNANGTTTTTMTMPTTTTTTTTTTTPSGASGPGATSGSPFAGGATSAVKLARDQRGASVRGSVKVSSLGAGGRLEVALLASGVSLAKVTHPLQVRVGRFLRSSLPTGVVSFAAPLNARARAALRRRRRLALTARIVLTPAHGATVTVTRSVLVRP